MITTWVALDRLRGILLITQRKGCVSRVESWASKPDAAFPLPPEMPNFLCASVALPSPPPYPALSPPPSPIQLLRMTCS